MEVEGWWLCSEKQATDPCLIRISPAHNLTPKFIKAHFNMIHSTYV
jgi:hypothetical protein